ncbi:hypothetical protein [Burkholderia vietnamiensis]|uniref:hypothetical protein n=1 Tax=Burkholderia vietnamiensis TaxID=60552 RepID=UPI001CB41592|nr:hypothetical protein [Burkholderia vietnamiensis]CAG9225738.1 hypothetical protein BVI434_450073 [Burkholderia vietnamiensis]
MEYEVFYTCKSLEGVQIFLCDADCAFDAENQFDGFANAHCVAVTQVQAIVPAHA